MSGKLTSLLKRIDGYLSNVDEITKLRIEMYTLFMILVIVTLVIGFLLGRNQEVLQERIAKLEANPMLKVWLNDGAKI